MKIQDLKPKANEYFTITYDYMIGTMELGVIKGGKDFLGRLINALNLELEEQFSEEDAKITEKDIHDLSVSSSIYTFDVRLEPDDYYQIVLTPVTVY